MEAEKKYKETVPSKLFKYRDSPSLYASKIVFYASAGLALGLAIDKICKRLQMAYNLRPSTMIIIQLSLLAIIFYAIETYVRKGKRKFLEIQNITPGLFFSGLVFSSQFNLLQNIKKFAEPL